MIVSRQLNYTKTRRFHAIFMPVIIEFSVRIGTYSSAKFDYLINTLLTFALEMIKYGGEKVAGSMPAGCIVM